MGEITVHVFSEYTKKRKGALPWISVHFERGNTAHLDYSIKSKIVLFFFLLPAKQELPQYGKYLEFDFVYDNFLKC